MKSVLFAPSKPKAKARPKPLQLNDVAGFAFVEVPDETPRLSADEVKAKLAAFYAKYPESRRHLRKGQKSLVEQIREDRDSR